MDVYTGLFLCRSDASGTVYILLGKIVTVYLAVNLFILSLKVAALVLTFVDVTM